MAAGRLVGSRALALGAFCAVLAAGSCARPESTRGAPAGADASASDTSAVPLDPRAQLRAAYVASRQAEGASDPAYAVHPSAAGASFAAVHPTMQVREDLDDRGLTLGQYGDRAAPWTATLAASAYGCSGATAAVEHDGAPRAGATPNRVEYVEHAAGRDLVESFVHGPLGMEHVLSLPESPCAGAPYDVEIDVRVAGLEPVERRGSAGVDLLDAAGRVHAHYTDLYTRDARGRVLPSSMSIARGAIVLRVDVSDATFPVEVDPLAWAQTQKIVANDGATFDNFGGAVAIDGAIAVVTAQDETIGSISQEGSAYVFVATGSSWALQAKLVPADPANQDGFGNSVAISGGTIVVGDSSATIGTNLLQGAAYVFVQSANTWTQQKKLFGVGGVAQDDFGNSVAIAGDTILVGVPNAKDGANAGQGAAQVYVRSGTTWSEQARLVASDGAAADEFGISVSLSGTTALVSADSAQVAGVRTGAAYVFVQSGTTWSQQAKLVATGASSTDYVGYAAAVSGDVAVLGAPFTMVGSNASQGVAYLFTRTGTTWTQGPTLVASDGQSNDTLGYAVSVAGGVAVVGSSNVEVGVNPNQGAAYVFVQSGSSWPQTAKLVASDGTPNGAFASGVSISGGTVLSGATGASNGTTSQTGAAYLFALTTGNPCTVGTDCATGYCAAGSCTKCTVDSQCPAGAFCNASGVCLAQEPNGAACNVAAGGDCASPPCNECTSGNCVGDFCCSTTCGPCGTCAGGTTCSVIAAGNPGGPPCTPYLCGGTSMSCPTSCANDADCASGNYCNASGACVAQLAQASACNQAAGADCKVAACRDCATGQCVDGFCCDTSCATLCQACAAALKESGTGDGTCGDAKAQTDPHNDSCPTSAASTCGPDGLCSGAGGCSLYYAAGTSCGVSACDTSTNSAVGQVCDGVSTTCADSATGVSCGEFLCAGGSCPTTCTVDTECVASAYCDQGTCVAKKPLGTTCATGGECLMSLCVDGVCCNAACTGECEACDGSGSAKGSCSPVVGAPHGNRPACPAGQAGVCSAATCDGTTTSTCAGFVGTGTSCRPAACQGNTSIPGASCDGKGDCPSGMPIDCGEYVCDPSTGQCKSGCASTTDCAMGGTCVSGQCVGGSTCTADNSGVIPPGGSASNATPCAPYVCQAGACQTGCGTVSDCLPPNVCDPSGACVPPANATTSRSGGCATSGPPEGDDGGRGALALAMVALLAARRRRSKSAGR